MKRERTGILAIAKVYPETDEAGAAMVQPRLANADQFRQRCIHSSEQWQDSRSISTSISISTNANIDESPSKFNRRILYFIIVAQPFRVQHLCAMLISWCPRVVSDFLEWHSTTASWIR